MKQDAWLRNMKSEKIGLVHPGELQNKNEICWHIMCKDTGQKI